MNRNEISRYVRKIKHKFNPRNIILFGSHADKKATKSSDVDLLIVMETKLAPIEQAVLIRKELPAPFPLDLMVRTPDEIKERIKKGDFFLKTVLKRGKKL